MLASFTRRRVAVALTALLLAVLSTVVGLRLAHPLQSETVLGNVQVSLFPAWQGRVEFYVPLTDWGIRAEAYSAPVGVRIEPRGLDRQALLGLAKDSGPMLRAASREMRDAVWRAAAWNGMWILLASALLSFPLWILIKRWGMSRRWMFAVPGLSLLASLGVLLSAWLSFNQDAFQNPTYWAKGGEVPQLAEFLRQPGQAEQQYQSSIQGGLKQLAGLLSGEGSGLPRDPGFLLASDLHSNLLALGAVEKLADHQPVFFAGDFAHEGGGWEQSMLVPRLAKIGRPMIAVSGNHDSAGLMSALASRGVVVLNQWGRLGKTGRPDGHPIYHLGNLKIMGFQDPLQGSFAQHGKTDMMIDEQAGKRIAADWARRVRKLDPDIVLVHQSGLAGRLARLLRDQDLLILTGHDHRQQVSRVGKAVIVDAGTVGAGGILGTGRQAVGLARLHWQGDHLSMVDMMRIQPLGGQGSVSRVVPSLDSLCHYSEGRCDYLHQDSPDQP